MPILSDPFSKILDALTQKNAPVKKGRTTESDIFTGESSGQNDFLKFVREKLDVKGTRKAKYGDYDELDSEPLPARALDIYASLVTQGEIEEDETSSTYRIVTKNNAQLKIFESMEKRLDLKRTLYAKVRSALKYGINSQEIVYQEFVGVSKLRWISPSTFRTSEDFKSSPNFVGQKKEELKANTEFVQVGDNDKVLAEFRKVQTLLFLMDGDESRIYGKSIFESVRKTLKIIDLLETSIAYRELNKAILKWLWLIDSTGLTVDEALSYVNKIGRQYQKPRFLDSKGNLNLNRSPLSDMGDIFLPVYKDGAPVDVKPLAQDHGAASLAVVSHFMSKFFGGVGIPSHYFSFEGPRVFRYANGLTYSDILLARLVFRYQSAIISSLYDLYMYESQFHGIDDGDFKLVFPLMGTIDDLRKYQILNLKVTVATALRINLRMVDDAWVFNFLKFSQTEATRLNAFRALVRSEEGEMMQDAADGVFVSPITTIGNPGKSPYEVTSQAETAQQQQAAFAQQQQAAFAQSGVPGESLIPDPKTVRQLLDLKHSPEEARLLHEKLNSERTFQALIQDLRIKNMVEDVGDMYKQRLMHDDPFNTGKLNGD